MSHILCFLLFSAIQLNNAVQSSSTDGTDDSGPNIDLVLIIHEGALLRLKDIMNSMKLQFPTFFPVAPEKTRVGVILNMPTDQFSTESPGQNQVSKRFEWGVGMNLIGDQQVFSQGLDEISEDSLNDSLQIEQSNLDAAKKMRDGGVHIFALYQASMFPSGEEIQVDRLTAISGDGRNLEHIVFGGRGGGLKEETFRWLKDRITDVLCGREQSCFFHDLRTKCQKAFYTPNLTSAQGDCTRFSGVTTPLSTEIDQASPSPIAADDKTCPIEKCETTCDHLWSTEVECLESNCGKEFPRKGLPRWEKLENCGDRVICPACSTTTTMLTTTTTAAIRSSTTEHAASATPSVEPTGGGKHPQVETALILGAVMMAMIGQC